MSKMKAAIFASKTLVKYGVDGSPIYQPSFTVVAESSGSQQFAGVTVAYDITDSSNIKRVVLKATNSAIVTDPEFVGMLNALVKCHSEAMSAKFSISSPTDVVLLKKLDIIFLDKDLYKVFNKPYKLTNKDTNGLKLIDFITREFTFNPNDIVDYDVNKSVPRKLAFDKRVTDWSLTWNSPCLTGVQKDYLKPSFDLDICMSNSNKDITALLLRTMSVVYPERRWVLNILFGEPSSGKTTMIEQLCALYNIPFTKLTGDPTISMIKLIMTVGPEQKEVTKASIIERLKANGFSDEDVISLDSQINETVIKSNGSVELTEQESIILICLKNNLPLVVLLDEVNMYTTLLQATLADVITSGYVSVGVHTYKGNPTNIKWFGAYNPNTYKASPFEQKFRDRALFFCSEMPTQEELIAHKQRKVLAKMFGCTGTVADLSDEVAVLKEEHPELSNELDDIYARVSLVALNTTPSPEAVEWFFNYEVDKLLGTTKPSFIEGQFSDYYKSDCVLGTMEEAKEATSRIIKLMDNINDFLKKNTVGIDSKNPDSNAYFYIPNRAFDYFMDIIMCYTSVKKATYSIVYNLIPNGGTVRYGTALNPAKDIAESCCTVLSQEIDELQAYLFTDFDVKACEQAIKDLTSSCIYDSSLWVVPSDTDTSQVDTASTTRVSEADFIDDLEALE